MHPQPREPKAAHVVVVADDANPELESRASTLAGQLGIPYRPARADADRRGRSEDLSATAWNDAQGSGALLLVVRSDRLELRAPPTMARHPLSVDFLGQSVAERTRSAARSGQLLARALGSAPFSLRVVDATAGLGRDTFLLAALGCQVLAIERSPILGAMLQDGLQRGLDHGSDEVRTILGRITIIVGDARNVLSEMTAGRSTTPAPSPPASFGAAAPDVVYLDPMYAGRSKAALPKKERRILRELVGTDPDAGELCAVARRVATKRVVVKRHPLAPPLMPQPDAQYRGKLVRFDAYTTPPGA